MAICDKLCLHYKHGYDDATNVLHIAVLSEHVARREGDETVLCSEPYGVEIIGFDKFQLTLVANAGFAECDDNAELRIGIDLCWVQEWYVSAA